MNKTKLQTEVGLDDAEIVSFLYNESKFTLVIKIWDESILKVSFDDVLYLAFHDTVSVRSIWRIDESTNLLEKVLARLYEHSPPESPEYNHYEFLDDDDIVMLEIVASSRSMSINREI